MAQLGFEQGAGDDISNALGSADFAQSMGNQDYFRSLFGNQLQYQQNRQLQKDAAKQQRKAAGNPFGQLAGMGLGALIPGGGALQGLFGGGQVSNNPTNPYFMGPIG